MSWGPYDLTGRCAVVTGGARGIGYGIADLMTQAGASVLVVDIDGDGAVTAAEKLRAGGARVAAMHADVTDPSVGDHIVARCAEELGPIDILVNNAGIYPMVPITDVTPESYDRVMNLNVRGLTFMARAAALAMIERGKGGVIVNLASIDGFHPSYPGFTTYGTSKGAVVQFTRALALELSPHRIRVNAIAPGGIDTEGAQQMTQLSDLTPDQLQALVDEYLEKVPLGRLGLPSDIAAAAVYLASDAASYVTGSINFVDGGILLK
jgi:2-deoxy-D-gluconate 3-dehydrogenase